MTVSFDFDAVRMHELTRAALPVERMALLRCGAAGATGVGVHSCVIASGDPALQLRLTAAAELTGWDFCDSASDAESLNLATGRHHRLVVVDLVTPVAAELAGAVESLVAGPDTLLIVFGAADSVEHEQWARLRGAFVHVPGVAAGDSLIALFSEARLVAERGLACC
jgi:hypothetical protein